MNGGTTKTLNVIQLAAQMAVREKLDGAEFSNDWEAAAPVFPSGGFCDGGFSDGMPAFLNLRKPFSQRLKK